MRVACLYFPAGLSAAAGPALAEACLRLSSQVALRPGEAVFAETGGSRLLYGEAGLGARLGALGRRFQAAPAPARLGLGAHAGEALARARWGPGPLPLEALGAYAAPFLPDEGVELEVARLVRHLRQLGLKDLEAFRRLPSGGWGERFGPNAAVLRERLEGRMLSAWPRFAPAARLEESSSLDDPAGGAWNPEGEALAFLLKGLADRLAARLRGRGLRAAGLELQLGFGGPRGLAGPAPRALALPLALPLSEPSQLRRLLHERLQAELARRPLPRPPAWLKASVVSTAPGFSAQREAFGEREGEAEALEGLVDRLAQRLGQGQVFYAQTLERHAPERAWRRRAPAEAPAAPARLDLPRPSRLLKRPLLLARAEDWLVYWGGGAGARRWRATDWQGPERIEPEWWLQAPQADLPGRDYWRVRTAEGMDLWVYSRPGEEARGGALWLQGWWG